MLQRRQHPLSRAEVQLLQPRPEVGVEPYPAAELLAGAALGAAREVLQGEVGQGDGGHRFSCLGEREILPWKVRKLSMESLRTLHGRLPGFPWKVFSRPLVISVHSCLKFKDYFNKNRVFTYYLIV